MCPNNSCYFILFKYNFSGWSEVYFLQHKNEAPNQLKTFVAVMKNQHYHQLSHSIRQFRGICKSWILRIAWSIGNEPWTQCPIYPSTERRLKKGKSCHNGSSTQCVSCMEGSWLPMGRSSQASIQSLRINQILTRKGSATPCEILHGEKPDTSHLPIFG